MILRRTACLAALAVWLLGGPEAFAFPDAKVDQQLRPDFSFLLGAPPPPPRRPPEWSPQRAGRPDRRHHYWDGRGARPPLMASVTADCADRTTPYPISDAADRVVDGGVVYVRARTGACTETIFLDHAVIIAPESAPVLGRNGGPGAGPILAPSGGGPCLRIMPGVKGVELHGLTFQVAGAREACIYAEDVVLALADVRIDYEGDAEAVFVGGGRLVMQNSDITARTFSAAVAAVDASVQLDSSRIVADNVGLDLTTPRPRQPRRGPGHLQPLWRPGRRRRPGGARAADRGGRRDGDNTRIAGWRTGVQVLRGGAPTIHGSRIVRTSYGVVSDGDTVVQDTRIVAHDLGLFSGFGMMHATNVSIFRVTKPGVRFDAPTQADGVRVFPTEKCGHTPFPPGVECISPDRGGRRFIPRYDARRPAAGRGAPRAGHTTRASDAAALAFGPGMRKDERRREGRAARPVMIAG